MNQKTQKQPKYITWKCPACGYTYTISQKENIDLVKRLCPKCMFKVKMVKSKENKHGKD